MTHYKLKFIDKLYLSFHSNIIDKLYYLIPKIEKHYDNQFYELGIRKPYNYEEYILGIANLLIFEYENLY